MPILAQGNLIAILEFSYKVIFSCFHLITMPFLIDRTSNFIFLRTTSIKSLSMDYSLGAHSLLVPCTLGAHGLLVLCKLCHILCKEYKSYQWILHIDICVYIYMCFKMFIYLFIKLINLI